MKKRENHGITMVELIVAASIASMVAGSAMSIWSYARRNISKSTTRQVMQADAQRILAYLSSDLKAARAKTFVTSENPMSLQFQRYVVSKDDNNKLSDKVEEVKYVLSAPILRRTVTGKATKNLSTNVENLKIDRKIISDEQKETDSYLEARIDIALDLKSTPPGSNLPETFSRHTSVVIRDEYYALANKEREEVLEIAAAVAEQLNVNTDSNFFKDTLDAASLMSLEPSQLTELDETQKDNIKQANEGLKELNDRIGDVDTGKKWWQVSFIGFLANEEGAEVKALRNRLEKVKCPDANIPSKESKTRPSDEVEAIRTEIHERIEKDETDFLNNSFEGKTIFDKASEDAEISKNAAAQQRAYEMKLMDRQIEKAKKAMSADQIAEAEANKTLPQTMVSQLVLDKDKIRDEFLSAGVFSSGVLSREEKEALDKMVEDQYNEAKFIKDQYDACDLAWMDKSENTNKVKAYEAAKQLKTLAESKKEALLLKELAIDNRVEIEKAGKLKKESFENNQ